MKRKKTEKNRSPQRFAVTAEQGLSPAQVEQRVGEGQVNESSRGTTRTVREIVFSNLCTYFNLIFFLLAVCRYHGFQFIWGTKACEKRKSI